MNNITTQKQIRKMFWEEYPEFKEQFFKTRKKQNDYPTDVRVSFCDFLDHLKGNNTISEKLAYRATL